jgi:hypothetical protein
MCSLYLNSYIHVRFSIESVQKVVKKWKFTLLLSAAMLIFPASFPGSALIFVNYTAVIAQSISFPEPAILGNCRTMFNFKKIIALLLLPFASYREACIYNYVSKRFFGISLSFITFCFAIITFVGVVLSTLFCTRLYWQNCYRKRNDRFIAPSGYVYVTNLYNTSVLLSFDAEIQSFACKTICFIPRSQKLLCQNKIF